MSLILVRASPGPSASSLSPTRSGMHSFSAASCCSVGRTGLCLFWMKTLRARLNDCAQHWRLVIGRWSAQVKSTGTTSVSYAARTLHNRTGQSVRCSITLVRSVLTLHAALIRSVVTDGITMGHPTCGSHNCQNPLPSTRARFCSIHSDLANRCAARDEGEQCKNLADPGYRTCNIQAHRKLEEGYLEQGRAMFQLRRRLEKLKVMQTNAALPQSSAQHPAEGTGDSSDVDIEYVDVCEGKPESGNRKLRARFGRSRTHNEELCVTSCGVILGRATFFGSEAPTSVIVRGSCL